jgi:RNA polymerase sigma factor (sigma-70 family)
VWLLRWLRSEQIRSFLKLPRGQTGQRERYRVAEKPAVWNAEDEHTKKMASFPKDAAERARLVTRQASNNGHLIFETDTELSTQLWLAARLQDITTERLVGELLTRGLAQEAFRVQAEAALATLTPREQEIAWLTAQGHTNRQIAENLVISPETVKTHMRHVLDKFNVNSKTDLRLLFIDLGVRWWEQ